MKGQQQAGFIERKKVGKLPTLQFKIILNAYSFTDMCQCENRQTDQWETVSKEINSHLHTWLVYDQSGKNQNEQSELFLDSSSTSEARGTSWKEAERI